jgi:hypothetical protein
MLIIADKSVKQVIVFDSLALVINTIWVRFSTWLKKWNIVPLTGESLLMTKILIFNNKWTMSIADTLSVGMLRNW